MLQVASSARLPPVVGWRLGVKSAERLLGSLPDPPPDPTVEPERGFDDAALLARPPFAAAVRAVALGRRSKAGGAGAAPNSAPLVGTAHDGAPTTAPRVGTAISPAMGDGVNGMDMEVAGVAEGGAMEVEGGLGAREAVAEAERLLGAALWLVSTPNMATSGGGSAQGGSSSSGATPAVDHYASTAAAMLRAELDAAMHVGPAPPTAAALATLERAQRSAADRVAAKAIAAAASPASAGGAGGAGGDGGGAGGDGGVRVLEGDRARDSAIVDSASGAVGAAAPAAGGGNAGDAPPASDAIVEGSIITFRHRGRLIPAKVARRLGQRLRLHYEGRATWAEVGDVLSLIHISEPTRPY